MATGTPVASDPHGVEGVMRTAVETERFDVVVVGGGQAGLAAAYHLARHGLRYVVLDAGDRIGDTWRQRWQSLRVFTAARRDGLPGMAFPAPPESFPTKDEVADYLESYATTFSLAVRTGVTVTGIRRAEDDGDGYVITTGDRTLRAGQVIVATGAFTAPLIPALAASLRPDIRQLHSSEYRSSSQLLDGPALVVGASHSGVEIAIDIARDHETRLVGRETGEVPFDVEGRLGNLLEPAIWFAVTHLLTVGNPVGRRFRAEMLAHGAPLERIKGADVLAAGVTRIPSRVADVQVGLPVLEDGRVIDAANVVWCTGFRPDFAWLDVPLRADGWPDQHRGVVPDRPGLYFVGLPFQHRFASPLIGGVGDDAGYVVERIRQRASDQWAIGALDRGSRAPGAAAPRSS
jgi:putative flavoprotein involved in K+ transport